MFLLFCIPSSLRIYKLTILILGVPYRDHGHTLMQYHYTQNISSQVRKYHHCFIASNTPLSDRVTGHSMLQQGGNSSSEKFWSKMSFDLFANVKDLFTQIDVWFQERRPGDSTGAQMAVS